MFRENIEQKAEQSTPLEQWLMERFHPDEEATTIVQQTRICAQLRQTTVAPVPIEHTLSGLDLIQHTLAQDTQKTIALGDPLAGYGPTIRLAESLGICTLKKSSPFERLVHSTVGQINRQENTLPNDRDAQALIAFSVTALGHSIDVPTISSGWNMVLVPGEVITTLLEQKPDRKKTVHLNTIDLARRGYILPATGTVAGQSCEAFFFSIDPKVGQRFRQSEAYATWMEQHRYNESKAQFSIKEAWPHSTAHPDLPSTIHLILKSELENYCQQFTTTAHSVIRLGYALSANSTSTKLRLHENGKYCFITEQPEALAQWQEDPALEQWFTTDTLKQWLLKKCVETLTQQAITTADYLPEEFQPGYIVTDEIITEAIAGTFDVLGLSQEGYIVPANQALKNLDPEATSSNRLYLVFPDAAIGKKFKHHAKHYEQAGMVYGTLLRQALQSAPVEQSTLPGANEPQIILSYNQLLELLPTVPGLSINTLRRNGYLLDAQPSPTSRRTGKFIVCSEGKIQSDAIRALPWYTAYLQDARNRSLQNL